MESNFKQSLKQVLVHEGGWSDHPRDPGGATMKGVTLTTFRRHFGSEMDKNNLRNITDEQLEKIYRSGYWDKCHCDDLPAGIDYAVFDAAVNSGPGRSARWLQAAVGATQDGAIGQKTLARVKEGNDIQIANEMCDCRLAFLRSLSNWPTFGNGWGRRVGEVRHTAIEMADGEIAPSVEYETVSQGSEGPWVSKLQKALQIQADGKFGPKTNKTLMEWQEAQGLEPDGVAGRNTYRALGLIA